MVRPMEAVRLGDLIFFIFLFFFTLTCINFHAVYIFIFVLILTQNGHTPPCCGLQVLLFCTYTFF